MINLNTISMVLIIVALICTLNSALTQITKEIGFLKKIPTALQVTVTSILFTIIGFIAYASYKAIKIEWYYIFAMVIVGIFIAYITMFGWDNLIVKFKSFYKTTDEIKEEKGE